MRRDVVWVACSLFLAACGSAQKPAATTASGPKASSLDRSRCEEKGKRLVTVDTNRDGKPDVFKLYQGNDLVCRKVDLDHDGHVDIVAHLDPGDIPVLEEFDLDFDGKIDEVVFYEKGQIVRKEFDTNHDGVPDIFKHFRDGRLVLLERDTKGSGTVDYWEEYSGGKLVKIKWLDPNAKGGYVEDTSPEEPDEAEVAQEAPKAKAAEGAETPQGGSGEKAGQQADKDQPAAVQAPKDATPQKAGKSDPRKGKK